DRYADTRVVDLDPKRSPFVLCDVGPALVVSVRIFPAQPVELPVRVGEILHRALVAWRGRVLFAAVERAQIDRLEMRLRIGDPIRYADEGAGIGRALTV